MKSNDLSYIIGTCEELCPQSEVKLRKNQKLLHYYEISNKLLVKEFSRSAADKKQAKAENLRSFKALRLTNEYLFSK